MVSIWDSSKAPLASSGAYDWLSPPLGGQHLPLSPVYSHFPRFLTNVAADRTRQFTCQVRLLLSLSPENPS